MSNYTVRSFQCHTPDELKNSGLLAGLEDEIKLGECVEDVGHADMTLTLPDDADALKRFVANLSQGYTEGGIEGSTKSYLFWDPTPKNPNDGNSFAIDKGFHKSLLESLAYDIKKKDSEYKLPESTAVSEVDVGNGNGGVGDLSIGTVGMIVVGAIFTGMGFGIGLASGRSLYRSTPVGDRVLRHDEMAMARNHVQAQIEVAEKGAAIDIDNYTHDLTGQVIDEIDRENRGEFSSRAVGPTVEYVLKEIDIAMNRHKNANAAIYTEAGGGKTETVKEYARRLWMRGERHVRVKEIDLGAMLAGAQFRGMFEIRLKSVLNDAVANFEIDRSLRDLAASDPKTEAGKEAMQKARLKIVQQLRVKARDTGKMGEEARAWLSEIDGKMSKIFKARHEKNMQELMRKVGSKSVTIIYFIDEFHTIVGAGNNKEGGLDASNMLKPLLADGRVRFIVATTKKERKHIEEDGALARRFEAITYGNASVQELELILKGGVFQIDDVDEKGRAIKRDVRVEASTQRLLEARNGVRFTDDAIKEVIKLTYKGDLSNPEKSNRAVAIDLMSKLAAAKTVLTKQLVGKLVEGGLSEAQALQQIKTAKHHVIDGAYVRKRYQEENINKPIREVRAKLRALEAEREWLLKPHTEDSWVFPEKAEVEMASHKEPIELEHRNGKTYVKDASGRFVPYVEYLVRMEAEVTRVGEEVAHMRGSTQEEVRGIMGNSETREVLNEKGKPHVRALLEEIRVLNAKLQLAVEGSVQKDAVDEMAVHQEVSKLDLKNLDELSRSPHETVQEWVKRLEEIKEVRSKYLDAYEGSEGIRGTLQKIYLRQIEWARRQHAPSGQDAAGIGLQDWALEMVDRMGAAAKAKGTNLQAISPEAGIPDLLQVPQKEAFQTPQDYLATLTETLSRIDKSIEETNGRWSKLYQAEEERLIENDLKDRPEVRDYVEKKSRGFSVAMPAIVKQTARKNVHEQVTDIGTAPTEEYAPRRMDEIENIIRDPKLVTNLRDAWLHQHWEDPALLREEAQSLRASAMIGVADATSDAQVEERLMGSLKEARKTPADILRYLSAAFGDDHAKTSTLPERVALLTDIVWNNRLASEYANSDMQKDLQDSAQDLIRLAQGSQPEPEAPAEAPAAEAAKGPEPAPQKADPNPNWEAVIEEAKKRAAEDVSNDKLRKSDQGEVIETLEERAYEHLKTILDAEGYHTANTNLRALETHLETDERVFKAGGRSVIPKYMVHTLSVYAAEAGDLSNAPYRGQLAKEAAQAISTNRSMDRYEADLRKASQLEMHRKRREGLRKLM